jgi:general secretion pathway protein H
MSPAGRRLHAGSADAGFTLIELLVGLTLIGLLLTIAIPLIGGDTEDTRAQTAARVLAADLRWLRQEAIARGQETGLRLDLEAKRYRREADGAERALPAAFALSFASLGQREAGEAPRIGFRPDGTSTGGRVELNRGTRRYVVDVSWPLGRIQVRS